MTAGCAPLPPGRSAISVTQTQFSLSSTCWMIRSTGWATEAVHSLKYLGDVRAVPHLTALLEHDDGSIRSAAKGGAQETA